jgi:CMP-2-keto-3-deoxyoctulosonic acid synthetase
MIEGKQIFVVIPARGGSVRLPRKNIHLIWGKPMIYWSIAASQASKYIDRVYVSTEDAEIADIARNFGAVVIERPPQLARPEIYKQDVIIHAAEAFKVKPEIIISLQANSPQICAQDLDGALEKMTQKNLKEIFSIDRDLVQNAAFRIMEYGYVFQRSLSTYCGVYMTDYQDIHTIDDIKFLEANSAPCKRGKEENDVSQ